MKTGGVLTSEPRSYLINDFVSQNYLGVYFDSISGKYFLKLKKHGYDIPIGKSFDISVNFPDGGASKGYLVTLNDALPCSECNYAYGLTFVSRYQQPGINNSEYHGIRNYVGGVIGRVSVSNNKISSDTLLAIEKDLITQINNIKNSGTTEIYPEFVATSFIELTVNKTQSGSVDVNGITVANNPSGSVSIVEAINGNNTLSAQGVVAFYKYASDTDNNYKVCIINENGGYIDIKNLTTGVTLDARRIFIYNKYNELLYSVVVDNNCAEISNINFAKIFAGSIPSGEYIKLVNDSTVFHYENNSQCVNGSALTFPSTGIFKNYVYNSNTKWRITRNHNTNNTVIYLYNDESAADVYISNLSVNTLTVTFNGRFKRLTTDDIFREMCGVGGKSFISGFTYANQPVKDKKYVKIVISYSVDSYGLVGADELSSFNNTIVLYAYFDNKCSNVFAYTTSVTETMNDNVTTYNKTLSDFIADVEALR